MAQVGRISGPLLTENLERLGKVRDQEANLSFETDLLYLDVINNKVGIRESAAGADLDVRNSTVKFTNLISDTGAVIEDYEIRNNNIQPATGNILLDSDNRIFFGGLGTDQLKIQFNTISSFKSNADIILSPNGTGTIEVVSDLNVDGSLHATGDITIDGNVTFGNDSNDSVTFNADVTSNIIPDTSDLYNFGEPGKRWEQALVYNLNGLDIETQLVSVGGLELGTRQGKIWYVSKNGNNFNRGDHQQGPFAELSYALEQATAGDTVYVYPGIYEESVPMVVPTGVTIKGHDIRNTIITPPSSSASSDIFHLNGETTITDITVKDFFYDSVNDTGYAFRFAPNSTITTRSPYIQNVTVITQGSITSAGDPRGFDQGDAGKGALVDGASVLGTSEEASMLFHSCTFITPGVDAITMTNGVRVEWLNSFTYFANRGLYAVDGVTGHLSTDGSTVKYGAELRSIGSANVYGNIGAEADGSDTLMYLINHNFAYIGTGKDSSNDNSLTTDQDTVELNSGKIYYQSQSHTGNFKVGNNFFVNFLKGTTSINVDEAAIGGLGKLLVSSNDNVTILDNSFIETGNLRFIGNSINSLQNDINVDSSNEINFTSDVALTKDLDITGNFSLGGNLITFGDQTTDVVDINTLISQDLNPKINYAYNLGSASKVWTELYGTSFNIEDVSFTNNFITTNKSNVNLTLSANGLGKIYTTNNFRAIENFSVLGSSDIIDTSITGSLSHTGDTVIRGQNVIKGQLYDRSQTNRTYVQIFWVQVGNRYNYTLRGYYENVLWQSDLFLSRESTTNLHDNFATSYTVGNDVYVVGTAQETTGSSVFYTVEKLGDRYPDQYYDVDLTLTGNFDTDTIEHLGTVRFENISFEGNKILNNVANNDIILSANGLGEVYFPTSDVVIDNDITVLGSVNTGEIINARNLTADRTTTSNIDIFDNVIETTISNSNLELRAVSGNINIQDSTQVDQNLDVLLETNLADTDITGQFNVTGEIQQTGTIVQTGNNTANTLTTTDTATFEDVQINDNTITTTQSNSDLELKAKGIVDVDVDAIIQNNLNIMGVTDVTELTVNNIFETSANFTNNRVDIYDNVIETQNENLNLNGGGTDGVVIENNTFKDNIVSSVTTDIEFETSENIRINKTDAVKIPVGTTADRRSALTLGELRFNSSDLVYEGQSQGRVTLGQVASDDRKTFFRPEQNNTLTATINNVLTTSFVATGIDTHGIGVQNNILIKNETISSANNSNINLLTQGTGSVFIDNNVQIDDNIIRNLSNLPLTLTNEGTGYVDFNFETAIGIPAGNDAERPSQETGDLRWNTERDYLEVFNGTQYQAAAGVGEQVTRAFMEDLSDEWSLILG